MHFRNFYQDFFRVLGFNVRGLDWSPTFEFCECDAPFKHRILRDKSIEGTTLTRHLNINKLVMIENEIPVGPS